MVTHTAVHCNTRSDRLNKDMMSDYKGILNKLVHLLNMTSQNTGDETTLQNQTIKTESKLHTKQETKTAIFQPQLNENKAVNFWNEFNFNRIIKEQTGTDTVSE